MIVPVGVPVPSGLVCLQSKVRFRHETEDGYDHYRSRPEDNDDRWFRLCGKP